MNAHEPAPPVLAYVTLSSSNPDRLREFYTTLMSLAVSFEGGAYAVIGDGPAPPVRLAFQRVHGTPAAAVHIDLHVPDIDAAAQTVVALGGTLGQRYQEVGSVWRQAFDPDGNVFCLMSPATGD
ncbi:MAG TPA: VOC family protein [Mycobacteriales bacterium]|nr:VOC family protein [Mycobacteriales bacterium]